MNRSQMSKIYPLFLLVGITAWSCSDNTTSSPVDAGSTETGSSDGTAPSPSVKIAKPKTGDSFEMTPNSTDIDFTVNVTNFTLVQLGSEGADPSKGQVRIFVDGHDCDNGSDVPPVKYNTIIPNAKNESTIGMDYCVGGVAALDNKTHTMEAHLYHGDTALSASDTITFKTTFSYGSDASADGSVDASVDSPVDAPTDAADAGSDAPVDAHAD